MTLDKEKLQIAEKAIQKIAIREGKSVDEIKQELQKAMFIGLYCSSDPAVHKHWEQIPHEGDMPTPEETIIFLAEQVKSRQKARSRKNKKRKS